MIKLGKNETPKAAEAAKPVANPAPTFDPSDPLFQRMVQEAVAAKLAVMQTEKPAMMEIAGKSDRQVKAELTCIRAFKKRLGIVVVPHVDVMTFNKWAAAGYRPRQGTKAVKVGAFRLFHKSQVRKLTADEMAKLKADNEAAIARNEAAKAQKVVPLTP